MEALPDDSCRVWRKMRDEELLECNFARNSTRWTELREVRWAGHKAGTWGLEFIHAVISVPEESRTVGSPGFGY